MQRAVSLTAVALTALLVVAPALAQSSLPSRSEFRFTSLERIDAAPAGDSAGDMTVFAFRVFDRNSGRRIGAGHGYCVRTEVAVARDCLANSSLPGGRVVLQWEEHDGQQVARAVITGGTGRYRGARGEVRLAATTAAP
jgi:hypothetical protein